PPRTTMREVVEGDHAAPTRGSKFQRSARGSKKRMSPGVVKAASWSSLRQLWGTLEYSYPSPSSISTVRNRHGSLTRGRYTVRLPSNDDPPKVGAEPAYAGEPRSDRSSDDE